MYSLERRRERYRIIYVWKVLENMVPNINNQITARDNDRRGRHCITPTLKRSSEKICNLHQSSLPVHGIKLFNAMPKHIRDMTNVSIAKFKRALDAHLALIPDHPLIVGYTARKQTVNNSIVNNMPKKASSVAVPPISRQEHLNRSGELDNLQS